MSFRLRVYIVALFAALGVMVTLVSLGQPHALAIGTSQPVAVLTQHNDNSRTGTNLDETILTTANVTVTQFGKVFTRAVDGQIYAQPLVVPDVNIPGRGIHNVVYVVTMHNTVYAFDADDPSAVVPLWQTSLGPSAPLPSPDIGPSGYLDIEVEVGTLSTSVIDPASHTLYAVAFTKESPPSCTSGCSYAHRLHAIDLITGAEKFGGPVLITGTVAGTGDGSINGTLTFNSQYELQRTALLLSNGVVYFAFASYGDNGPYHGWVFGYNAATLQRVSIFNDTPDGQRGGIWQTGQGLAADANGSLYLMSGNGTFTADTGGSDYGTSFLRLSPSGVVSGLLPVADYFTPHNQTELNDFDYDLGSTGPVLIPGTNLLYGIGKEGWMYLLNRSNLGQYNGPIGPDNVVQSFQAMNNINKSDNVFASPIYWNSPAGPRVYMWGAGDPLKEFGLSITGSITAAFQTTPIAASTAAIPADKSPGGTLSLSANGNLTGTGIVWAVRPNWDTIPTSAILYAFDATNVGIELWNSGQNQARDGIATFAKFSPPTVANGKVYLATFSNQLLVYGLLAPSIVRQPMSQTITSGDPVTLTVLAIGQSPLSYQWYRGSSGNTSNPIGINAALYSTSTLTSTTSFWVRVTNPIGTVDSATAVVTVKSQYSLFLPVILR